MAPTHNKEFRSRTSISALMHCRTSRLIFGLSGMVIQNLMKLL